MSEGGRPFEEGDGEEDVSSKKETTFKGSINPVSSHGGVLAGEEEEEDDDDDDD